MFRRRKKIERDHPGVDQPGRMLNYAAPQGDDDEPKRRFWPDRDGWKQLGIGCLAHGIIEPLLIILLIWLGFKYLNR